MDLTQYNMQIVNAAYVYIEVFADSLPLNPYSYQPVQFFTRVGSSDKQYSEVCIFAGYSSLR